MVNYKGGIMDKRIQLKELNKLFESNDDKDRKRYSGKCSSCGCDVTITIERTSGGYGLLGGVLYESEKGELFLTCSHCLKKPEGNRKIGNPHLKRMPEYERF
jgi:hypothetical protein